MKPRSQRNRKRPRSEVHSNDGLVIQADVVPLELDGKPVSGGSDYIRVIRPYPYTFSSHAKSRWIGRTLLDVYSAEFGSFNAVYYNAAIQQGRILVSDQQVEPSYIIKANDVLSHTVHRHEPAVAVATRTSPFVKIVAETETLVVVDKPGTLPVHPCGGYHENSLMNLLQSSFGKLFTINRLDRLTSGLVILGKTSAVAKKWGKAIQERDDCEKIYLARVKGHFPRHSPEILPHLENAEELASLTHGEWTKERKFAKGDEESVAVAAARKRNAYGYFLTDSNGTARVDITLSNFSQSEHSVDEVLQSLRDSEDEMLDQGIDNELSKLYWLHLCCPVRIEQPKNGVCKSGTFEDLDSATYLRTVKSAQTSFALIHYDSKSDSSIVLCRPATGRTHQIRLHLEYLGHPIANDPNYGGKLWYDNPEGQQSCKRAQELLDSMDEQNEASESQSLVTTDIPATASEVLNMVEARREEKEPLSDFIRRTCVWCARSRGGGEERTKLEFLVRSSGIWLHALQYRVEAEGECIAFRTELPVWSY